MRHLTKATNLLPCLLAFVSVGCGVGGIGQTTSSPVQPAQVLATQTSTAGTTGYGTTSAVVDPDAPPSPIGTGADTAGSATTAGEQTSGNTTAEPPTGTMPGATTGGDGNTTTGQDGNDNLFDMSALKQACCYYDETAGQFALSLSNDVQYCMHAASGVRMAQDHDLAIAADLSAKTTATNPNDPPNNTPAQPKNVSATLSQFTKTCALQGQAKSISGSVTLSQADSMSCSGTFNLSMQQTQPTLMLTTTQLNGSFTNAPNCAALVSMTPRNTCQ